jgi:thiol-disulfide isomerase/thioredoxin
MADGETPARSEVRRGRGRQAIVLAVLVLAVVAGAVYVTARGGSNSATAAACLPAAEEAARLDPLVGGEVAAFQLAEAPQDLSGLAFTDAAGQPATLAAFKGRVALVNLWATWCGPCRAEMPALDRLQAAKGGDDFAVVPISIDIGDRARPAAFLDSIGVKSRRSSPTPRRRSSRR